jgi:hypothetical protein
MAQQFVGLRHCSCGVSWKAGIGYFNRSADMVFVLERRTVGKRTRQVPVIHYKSRNNEKRALPKASGQDRR